jgi:hypothetical protein
MCAKVVLFVRKWYICANVNTKNVRNRVWKYNGLKQYTYIYCMISQHDKQSGYPEQTWWPCDFVIELNFVSFVMNDLDIYNQALTKMWNIKFWKTGIFSEYGSVVQRIRHFRLLNLTELSRFRFHLLKDKNAK